MTEAKAKTLSVVAVGAAVVLSSLEHLAHGERPPLSTLVGASVAGVGLLTLAEVSPDLAGGFALVLLLGATLRNGVGAVRTIQTAID